MNKTINPLGVSPHWIEFPKRIEELHNAIGRYMAYIYECRENRIDSYTLISEWAKELSELAALEAKLLREKEE